MRRHISLETRLDVLPALSAMLSLLALLAGAGPAPAAGWVEPPRLSVDTTLVPPSGRSLAVPAGGNLQAALDRAQPGDVITLAPGATYGGPFVLPNKNGPGWVIVRTAAPDSSLPPSGTRVDPSYAPQMPKLEAAAGTVIVTVAGAHHYRFIGIEIRPSKGAFLYNLVQLGTAERSADQLPHHIVFDRCYLHGDPRAGTRRGVAMNSRYTAVIDSYLSDFKEVGADSQAIAGWNGPGPFKITNNYLEGAGENLIFGGADPSIPGLVPSDIEIRRNRFAKPLPWKIGDPTYEGTPWTIKNLFELKNARRVLIDGNLFEYNWAHAQSGFGILFTVRNQDGGAPWSVVEDVTFTNNILRHTGSGINILGRDDIHSSQQTRRILIRNNLLYDVGGARWGGVGRLFQLLNGAADVVIERNTALQTGNIITADGFPHPGFVFRGNVVPHNAYGIIGSDTGVGNPALARYFPGAVVRENVIVGGNPQQYPPDNDFPRSLDEVGIADPARGDSTLARSGPFKRHGAKGKEVGVDLHALATALAGTLPSDLPFSPGSLPRGR